MNTPSHEASGQARVKRPERFQIQWQDVALDELLPADHRARLVWAFVERLDLGPLYAEIRAVEGVAGRDAVAPQILVALWLFATVEGVSSARHLDRLCERDVAYRWLCGGVGVNYHLLSDFRTAHGAVLEQLLTDTVATLLHQGLVTLNTVAQDGMRVRASAGKGSFRREKTLQECQAAAREHVRQLRAENEREASGDTSRTRREASQARAAQEREERVTQALQELAELQQQKEQRKPGTGGDARASTTDPEARVMKMGDGGFRPAYNVQFATDGDARIIVAVDVTNSGSDRGQMAPLHEEVCTHYGKTPQEYVVDCGFVTKEDITTVAGRGSRVIAPLHSAEKMREAGQDPHARQRSDSDAMFAFRQRMATAAATETLQRRSSIAEFPNAECRNRGLQQFRVRGLKKVRTVALWYALAFNLLRMINLGSFQQAAPE